MDTKQAEKWACWYAAAKPPTLDPAIWRVDPYGRLMHIDAYGNRDVEYGWEVDHIRPMASAPGVRQRDSLDTLFNKQALNWRSNVAKSDRFPGESYRGFPIDYAIVGGVKTQLPGHVRVGPPVDYSGTSDEKFSYRFFDRLK